MKNMNLDQLNRFYKGEVTEEERTLIEEFLFTSEVGLMEYFSIKRDAEVQVTFLKKPTNETKMKLLNSLGQLKPATVFQHRRGWVATACATASGFALVIGAMFWPTVGTQVANVDSAEQQQIEFQKTIETALDSPAGGNFY